MTAELQYSIYSAAVRSAQVDLARLTERRVKIQYRPGEGAELVPAQDCYTVFVDTADSLAEHSLVHEMCHAIMYEEGYPFVMYPPVVPGMISFLSNDFQHGEVYRRMHNYGLDMASYLACNDQEIGGFVKKLTAALRIEDRHIHVWHISWLVVLGSLGEKYLTVYANTDRPVFELARSLVLSAGGNDGFSTVGGGRQHVWDRQ